jgi:hypothetical protein
MPDWKLRIETPTGSVGGPDRWLAFLSRELRDPDGYVIVDNGMKNSFAQAYNHSGTLLLEYRDGSPSCHFQVCGAGLAEVAEALSQWADGRREFIEQHEWTRLDFWDDPSTTKLSDE